VTYHEKFGVQWQERETTVSERFTYEIQTHETFETVEEVEEVVDEKVAEVIISWEREIVIEEETVQTEKATSTATTHHEENVSEVAYEVEVVDGEEITKLITTIKETGIVAEPAVTKKTSWFRRLADGADGAAAAAAGAGAAASGVMIQVDGVWKRSVHQVLTTRKAHVDAVAPIAKTSYVYYDDEVYDAVLTEKSTGITYVIQLLFDSSINKYYVYIRWGETDYKLDGPHETIESAKTAFKITYHHKFDVKWEQREIVVSERFSYEIKTYKTFETVEDIEEIVEDYEVSGVVAKEQVVIEDERVVSTHHSITSSHDDTIVRAVSEKVLFQEGSATDNSSQLTHAQYETLTHVESSTGSCADDVAIGVEDLAVGTVRDDPHGTSHAVSGTLTKVDGVWKRTVQVITTRKAHVDSVAPIAKTSYVYYDDEVYDAVLVEKSTGITYVTQLLFDSSINKYYVYIRWGETDYKLDGPHETIESAKTAFKITYHHKFGVKWQERETTVS
ncbi:hypothetical protein BGX29_004193, partial [Mortierella sp. GBA35]